MVIIARPAAVLNRTEVVKNLNPATIMSSHLLAATDMTPIPLGYLAAAAEATSFQGPDQAALEQLMTGAIPSPAENRAALQS